MLSKVSHHGPATHRALNLAGCYNRSGCAASPTQLPALLVPLAQSEFVGEWLSLVEHLVRDQGVGGSNPLSPTIYFQQLTQAATGSRPTHLVLHQVV